MNSLIDTDIEPQQDARNGTDREISLGTATILGIFFALALVCAAFFGFGYTLGRKSAQNAGQNSALMTGATAGATITIKPAAGSATGQPLPVAPAEPLPGSGVLVPIAPAVESKSGLTPADAMIVGDKPVGDKPTGDKPSSNSPQPAAANQQPAISPGGAFMVQIAAVSSQEIADIETTALKKYGFDVIVRHEPQDQLLHVQIGPYATRKDAEAMRQTILAHGFNAIVK
jgi:DedD protein